MIKRLKAFGRSKRKRITPTITNDQRPLTALIEDEDWIKVVGEAIKVINFKPIASLQDGIIVPDNHLEIYATIEICVSNHPQIKIAAICYEIDFRHLWAAYRDRGVSADEQVIVFWVNNDLSKLDETFASYVPRLAIMVAKNDAYDLLTNPNYKPDLVGEARYKAEKALISWPKNILGSN